MEGQVQKFQLRWLPEANLVPEIYGWFRPETDSHYMPFFC